MTVSNIIADMIKSYGTRVVFTLTGGPQEPLTALSNRHDIRVILGRSERSSLFMADAYARLTARPAFGFTQYGPGAALLPSALADAWWGHSPVVAISSSTKTSSRHLFEYQEIDQMPMFPPLTKWAGDLPAPERIADILRTAVHASVTGTPGPVYLGIPSDWYTKDLPFDQPVLAEADSIRIPAFRSAPLISDIERAVAALVSAQRPVILAGGGVLISGAWDELTNLAERLAIPVVTTLSGKGSIAENHRLAVGVGGRYSRKVANDVLAKCDLCLAIGTRLGAMGTDSFKFPHAEARLIHMDQDPMVLGRTYSPELAIAGDARSALVVLSDVVEQAGLRDVPARWLAWTEDIQKQVAEWRRQAQRKATEKGEAGGLNPYFVAYQLNEILTPDDILVADTGYMAAWAGTLVEQKRPGRRTLRAAGSLGWGFPGALGARLAADAGSRVVCLIGDGGFGYHLSDIETALRLNLDVTVVVMNNASLGFSYHVQRNFLAEKCPEAVEFRDLDFASISQAFGGGGERVTDPDKLVPAIRGAMNGGRFSVVDVVTSREELPPVTRVYGAKERPL